MNFYIHYFSGRTSRSFAPLLMGALVVAYITVGKRNAYYTISLILCRSDSILADPDEFVPFELAVNGKYGPIGGNGGNPVAPPPPPPPASAASNNQPAGGAMNGKPPLRRPCTLSIPAPSAAATAQAQFFSSTTTTTITTPLGALHGARNSPVAASWYFNSPQGYPAAAHIVASPVGAMGQSYITIHSPAGIMEPPNFFGGHKTPKRLVY